MKSWSSEGVGVNPYGQLDSKKKTFLTAPLSISAKYVIFIGCTSCLLLRCCMQSSYRNCNHKAMKDVCRSSESGFMGTDQLQIAQLTIQLIIHNSPTSIIYHHLIHHHQAAALWSPTNEWSSDWSHITAPLNLIVLTTETKSRFPSFDKIIIKHVSFIVRVNMLSLVIGILFVIKGCS